MMSMAVLVPHNYFFVNVSTLVYSLSLSCARAWISHGPNPTRELLTYSWRSSRLSRTPLVSSGSRSTSLTVLEIPLESHGFFGT